MMPIARSLSGSFPNKARNSSAVSVSGFLRRFELQRTIVIGFSFCPIHPQQRLSPEFLPRKPRYLLSSHWNYEILLLVAKMKDAKQKTDVPHGTLGLMVLKTLDVIGPLNGYAIARRIEQISGDLLAVNQGTLYPVLLKLEQEGAIESEWGTSENNRRARFYRVSRAGRKLLQAETRDWEQTTAILGRFFELTAEDLT
jgi:PadR family transcriptional regulator, regulatory protein PadR